MHQIHFLSAGARPQIPLGELTVSPDPFLYLWGLLLRGWRETGGGEKVKGKEGERWREGFGPPKNFGVAPPMGERGHVSMAIPDAVIFGGSVLQLYCT